VLLGNAKNDNKRYFSMLFLEKENQPMNPNLPSPEPQSKRNEQEIPTDNQFKRHKISQFPHKK
jgi:hypothetical protein